VLLRVQAAALDRGTWHLMTGRPYLMRLMGFGFRKPKQPIPGLDVAGTVVEVGPAVTRFKVGDEVLGIAKGSYAQFAPALESKLAKKPATLTFEQAAAIPVSGGTAIQAIDAAGNFRPGARVLVLGASGGVGTFAVQLAKALGAEVTAAASASKLDFVRSLGADRPIDYATGDHLTKPHRYDAILDIGGNTPLARLRRALAPEGRLVFVGGEHGGDLTGGFGRQLRALAVAPFTRQKFVPLMTKEDTQFIQRVAAFVERGQLTPAIDRVVPLNQLRAAMEVLVAGKVCGKIVLKVE
ncbi:MAG TPA: NAD(P)-dependent alcohol dehydrogenase, partial [Phycisphaerae bacterium]|nr:NAD(P)-dependent alcohol dehydrogenase [Phycisphaerae bacterium]